MEFLSIHDLALVLRKMRMVWDMSSDIGHKLQIDDMDDTMLALPSTEIVP